MRWLAEIIGYTVIVCWVIFALMVTYYSIKRGKEIEQNEITDADL